MMHFTHATDDLHKSYNYYSQTHAVTHTLQCIERNSYKNASNNTTFSSTPILSMEPHL